MIGETGRISCQNLRANNVVVAGAVKGNIYCGKTGNSLDRACMGGCGGCALLHEEGAFLRGQVRMEETVDLHLEEKKPENVAPSGEPAEPAAEKDPKNCEGRVEKLDIKFWLGYASEWLGVIAVTMIAGVSPLLKKVRQIEIASRNEKQLSPFRCLL